MALGVGIDLVSVARIERAMQRRPEAFARRILTETEYAYCMGRKRPAECVAARFCAKEAVMKAVGTGLSGGVTWQDAEVVRDERGRPGLKLTGRLAEIAWEMGVREVFVSISHDRDYAVAQVVLEG